MVSQRPLTLYEKLDYIPAVGSIFGTALYSALTAPFRGKSGADTYGRHVLHSIMRKALNRLSGIQAQYSNVPFDEAYEKFCKGRDIRPDYVATDSGVKGFWVGDKNAKYVVIYYHGGGFVLHGTEEHLKFWHQVQTEAASSGATTAFFYVRYTLTPHATYPIQVREAVQGLRYVLEELRRSPSEVILAGDSAGANLSLAVLSHIMHPSPDVPPLQLGQPLKALILMAPWISFRDQPSMQRNAYKDFLSLDVVKKWSDMYMAGQEASPYSEALLAPAEWWDKAPVEKMLVVAGADEVLVDSISEWVGKYQSVNPDVTYVVGTKETHDAPIFWPSFGDSRETEQGAAIKSWMKSRL